MTDLVEFGRAIADRVKQSIAKAVEPLEASIARIEAREPAKGEKGDAGEQGLRGEPAEPVTADQIRSALLSILTESPELITSVVKEYLTANPPENGKDGADGKDAAPISEEQISKAVASHIAQHPPAPGRDGRDGLAGINGEKGLNGTDGKDGRDALSLDDIELEAKDGGRIIAFRLKNAEKTIEREIVTAIPIDRDVFKDGETYARGDAVTFGGHLWIAQKDAPGSRPGAAGVSGDWRLSVKRGRDGKPGENGKDFKPPQPVKL